MRRSLLGLLAVVAVVVSGIAQSRVIHRWVDPNHGVDSGTYSASTLNPAGQTECSATINQPNDMTDPAQNNAVLLHAPWPFRTISGALATLPTLPYTSPRTGITWEYAIIHLMPGLYGRSQSVNYFNGMRSNGESFPILLPNRVSIQGASALNTVLDMEANTVGPWGPMFLFGSPGYSGFSSTIDNVTLTGMLRQNEAQIITYATAVYCTGVDGEITAPTITNCFFYGNEVGVGLISNTAGTIFHEPTIDHNTFAWNQCGLWSGQIPPPTTGSVGVSLPIVLNNIFDASPPDPTACPTPTTWQTFYSLAFVKSGFEGIDTTDMTVAGGGNFNAFETNKYDLAIAFIPGFPATTVRTGFPTPAASRDISVYTGGASSQTLRRGVLFVRDLICNGSAAGTFPPYNTGGFDIVPHDFRLSPAVARAGTPIVPPGGPGGALNPLVDNGWSGTFPLTMANGRPALNNPPGYLVLPSADQATWTFSSWKVDCDGYGCRWLSESA